VRFELQLELLDRIGSLVDAPPDLARTAPVVAEAIAELLGAEGVMVAVRPRTGSDLVHRFARGIEPRNAAAAEVPIASDALLERVRPLLGDRLSATHSGFSRPDRGEAGLLEISAGGVNKASMLAYCCEQLGVVAADVAGFGDMPNDVDMLSWVGMPHVVANAHPALRERYQVVPSNAESGVGRTILGWLE
jgi:hypothetical protein